MARLTPGKSRNRTCAEGGDFTCTVSVNQTYTAIQGPLLAMPVLRAYNSGYAHDGSSHPSSRVWDQLGHADVAGSDACQWQSGVR